MLLSMVPSSVTVLLADDEADILESLRLAFRMQGFVVQTFANGRAVLDYLASTSLTPPFALVSDILMPGLSGLDLIREFKRRYPHQAAVAITGHGDKPMVMELLRCGCDDFLDKPFEPAEVLTAVRRALDLCEERAQALRSREGVAAGAATAAASIGGGVTAGTSSLEEVEKVESSAPQVRLRAIEALEKEIQHTLPTTVVAAAAEPPLPTGSFHVALAEGKARIVFQGDCVGSRSGELRVLCEELITRGVSAMEFDLAGVEDLDALALSVLCSLSEELQSAGGSLYFQQVASPIRLLFQHLGLSDVNASLPTAA